MNKVPAKSPLVKRPLKSMLDNRTMVLAVELRVSVVLEVCECVKRMAMKDLRASIESFDSVMAY